MLDLLVDAAFSRRGGGSGASGGPVSDAAKNMFGVTFGIPGAETWEFARRFVSGLSLGPKNKITNPYAEHPTVALAISTIAEDAASVEWEAFRAKNGIATGDSVNDAHPVMQIFRKPNPMMVGDQLWVGTSVSYLLWGECFWYYPDLVVPPSNGMLPRGAEAFVGGRLDILDPRNIIVTADGDDPETSSPVYWMKSNNGTVKPLDPSRLTHFKRYNPYNPLRGLSMLISVIAEYEGDHAAALWNERFFSDQNGIPAGLLIPSGKRDADLNQPQKEDLLRQFNAKHGGGKRSVGLLPAGWNWEDLGISQREMDFKELRDYSREQILGVFGVPPFRAGVLDKANYANAREQDKVYWKGTIQRHMLALQAVINTDFFPKVGITDAVLYPRWETVKALLEDMKGKADTAKLFHGMGIPMQMINDRLELGFDLSGVEGTDQAWVPVNMFPVEMALSGELRVGRDGDGDGQIGDKRLGGGSGGGYQLLAAALRALLPDLPSTVISASPDTTDSHLRGSQHANGRRRELPPLLDHKGDPDAVEKAREARWKMLEAQRRPHERSFNTRWRSHVAQIETEVLANVDSLKGWVAANAQRDASDDAERLLFDRKKADKRITRKTSVVFRQAFEAAGNQVMAEIEGAKADDDFMDSPLTAAALSRLSREIKGVNDTVEARLRKSLVEGLKEGESVNELAKRVRHTLKVDKNRGLMIARTEIGKAFSSSRDIVMGLQGIKTIEWLSSRDPDVRDSHKNEDTNRVQRGKKFPVTGLRHPQEFGGPPEEVINCRCIVIPVNIQA